MRSVFYRSEGITQTRKREREWTNIETVKCMLFVYILLCLCASSFLHHILCTASSHLNTVHTRDTTMENTCPLPLLTHKCPSFLAFLTQLCWLPVSGIVNWWSGQQTHFRINVSSKGGKCWFESGKFSSDTKRPVQSLFIRLRAQQPPICDRVITSRFCFCVCFPQFLTSF